MMKSTGEDTGFEDMVDLSKGVVKSITEGKTQVVFETQKTTTPETALDQFIQNLRNGGGIGIVELIRFRRLPGCRR